MRLALLVLLAIAGQAAADEGLSVGFGKAMIGSEACFDSLLITQELAEKRFLLTLATHGEGYCRDQHVRANMGLGMLRTTQLGRWSLGFGGAVYEHGDRGVGPAEHPDRPQLCAQILIRRYLFNERAVLDILHCSTGGSTYYNPGKNWLTLGMRF